MEKLEKVELVREKAGVTYQEARTALEACGYDVLDAIVTLEREGKAAARTATYATGGHAAGTVSPEMAEAQQAYEEQSRKMRWEQRWDSVKGQVARIVKGGLTMSFVAERNGERLASVPLLILVLGLFAWGASLWLLIIGLFFGFRYRIEGASPLTIDVNDAMDKAADVAEGIRRDLSNTEE